MQLQIKFITGSLRALWATFLIVLGTWSLVSCENTKLNAALDRESGLDSERDGQGPAGLSAEDRALPHFAQADFDADQAEIKSLESKLAELSIEFKVQSNIAEKSYGEFILHAEKLLLAYDRVHPLHADPARDVADWMVSNEELIRSQVATLEQWASATDRYLNRYGNGYFIVQNGLDFKKDIMMEAGKARLQQTRSIALEINQSLNAILGTCFNPPYQQNPANDVSEEQRSAWKDCLANSKAWIARLQNQN